MRIALGQINPCVGDLTGNAELIIENAQNAVQQGAELIIFPELCVCGYPPEDLLCKPHFLKENYQTVQHIAQSCPEKTIITGFAEYKNENCYNSAAVIQNGKIAHIYRKGLLPNFGVFDEKRYFSKGNKPLVFKLNDLTVAVTICRDIWDIDWLRKFFKKSGQIDLILNISASPFHIGKIKARQSVILNCAKTFGCAVAYCNLVGGQDEIVFDGRSILANSNGNIAAVAKPFQSDLLIADITKQNSSIEVTTSESNTKQPADLIEEIYQALVLGTKDYTVKNGFNKVLIGLSGGIDSSLVAAIAVESLGSENVIGITMPTRFNSPETIADAEKLAENLGIEFHSIPIKSVLESFNLALKPTPGWDNKGIAYENLQARIRGTILMSLSNQFNALVLTTGNKSETAVGYSTLYGDTAGGFAVIKDVPKTIVYKLSEFCNIKHNNEIIPPDVITRPPSAELRDDQKDSDSLPDYDTLDMILEGYIEKDRSADELVKEGLPKELVEKVLRMVDRNEYKRRQSPPGIKITPKAFGKDRRLPITNKYTSCKFLD